jgi:hypothetical protein
VASPRPCIRIAEPVSGMIGVTELRPLRSDREARAIVSFSAIYMSSLRSEIVEFAQPHKLNSAWPQRIHSLVCAIQKRLR